MKLVNVVLWASAIVGLGCASSSQKDFSESLSAPKTKSLAPLRAYEGHWEMSRCLYGAKQPHRLRIEVEDQNMTLSRWQWRGDEEPQFSGTIKPEAPLITEFHSEDLISRNPVISKAHWTWSDQRIQGQLHWFPGPGDPRGVWTAKASGQFHVEKANPEILVWSRWGTTESDRHGHQEWTSRCEYKKIRAMGERPENGVDFSKIQLLQTLS